MKFYIEENNKQKELNLDILNIQKDDVIVINVPISNEGTKRTYAEKLKDIFPNNKVLIKDNNTEISIIRNKE